MQRLLCCAVLAILPLAAAAEGEIPRPRDPREAPPLDLASLLREAEANNPEIAAAASRRSAAEALPSQAETYPDPVATVSYTNETFTELTLGERADAVLAFGWTQEVPYPGKRRLAGDAARREVDVAGRRLDRVHLAVLAGVKQAYADLYRIDRSDRILTESRALLVSFLDTARSRYEVGEGLLQNVLKAQTEISKLDVELARLTHERISTWAALDALTGRNHEEPLGRALALPAAPATIDLRGLEEAALAGSPEILEAEAALRRDEARHELARRQTRPDLMWGAAYMNRGDLDPMVMGMFGVRLPLFRDRKQAQGVVQAAREAESAMHDAAAVRLQVLAEVRDLAARAARAQTLERLYAEGVIAQARSALESAAASYGVGRVDFLTLLSDFTTLLGYEIDHEVQRADRISALAALERLTGRALVTPAPAAPQEREVVR